MLGRFHGGYHIMTQTACSVLSLHNFPLTEFVMNLRTPTDSILAAVELSLLVPYSDMMHDFSLCRLGPIISKMPKRPNQHLHL